MFQPPKSLIDAVRQRTLVPFIGAGMSVGAVHDLTPDKQFPDWNGLILRLAKRLENDQGAAVAARVSAALPDTMAAAQLAVDSMGRTAFLEEMESAFGRMRPPVGANLTAIQAIWRLQPPFVITTNYDLVLEWPEEPGQAQRIHNDDPSGIGALDLERPRRRIWHLHGSIERVDTLILTSSQYKTLYSDGNPKRLVYQNAFERFRVMLATRPFLFLGFSLAEPVLRRKLEEVLDITDHAAPIKFLLLRAGETDDAKKKEFFDKYNVQVIEFEQFGAPMIAAIDAIGREAWPDAVRISRAGLTAEMEPLVDDLLKRVAGLSLPSATVARIFNATKPTAFPYALTGGDGITLLAEAIVQLGRAVSSGETGLPPLLDFADQIKNEASEPWLSLLQIWLDDAIERIGADANARFQLKQRLATARSAAIPGPVHVIVRIAPLPTAPGKWLVHAWSWSGLLVAASVFEPEGRLFDEGSSGEVVYELVAELEARHIDSEVTSIAFLVPSLLACEAIHGWRLADSVASDPPIGASHTVTVRPLERLDRRPLFRRRLKTAWNDLKKDAAQVLAFLDANAALPAAGVPALFLDAAAAVKQDLDMTLEKRGVRCVVLREPPCATALAQLTAVLNTRTPAVLWYRDSNATSADVEKTMRAILESGPIADLPRRIRDERLEAFRDETGTHRGMNLTLIWDDADYLPPENDPAARAKVETI